MTSPVRALSEPPEEKRWWVVILQKAEGPYVTDQVFTSLKTGAIPPDAQACLVGTRHWAPLSDWPEFAEVASLVPPPLPPSSELVNSHPLINRQLPSMANWICVYCIALRPVISALGLVAAITSGGSGVSGHLTAEDVLGLLDFAVPTLATTTAMVIGGVRLRNLRESGPTLIKAAIWASLGCFALAFVLIGCPSDGEPQYTAGPQRGIGNDRSGALRFARLPAGVGLSDPWVNLASSSRQIASVCRPVKRPIGRRGRVPLRTVESDDGMGATGS